MWQKIIGAACCAAVLAAAAPAWAGDVAIAIDAGKVVGPISPYVYGINGNNFDRHPYIPFTRSGGNRLTAYNWENNASNAGSDWHFQNDSLMSKSDTPGEAMQRYLAPAMAHGAAAILTIPMAGYVSADKKGDGDVRQTPDYLKTRFVPGHAKKNAPFQYPPDLTDHAVYQDEFVWWINREFPESSRHGGKIFYDLDNEPALWSATHAEVHPAKVTYAELADKTEQYAAAIKAVDPDGLIFGFVSYGYASYMHLQDAPDANGRDFTDFFLEACRKMEADHGQRLVDALDLHWYPEARGDNQRIVGRGTSPGLVAARVQAPRSLWDPTYTEDSWITNNVLHEPIRLIPRIQAKIDQHYPGTKLAFTEYDYGGGNHISGTIAEADVLGIFGEHGVFAASLWGGGEFIYAGFDCYRNYDGHGGHTGDEAVASTTSAIADVAVHAARYTDDASKLSVVLINRSTDEQTCTVTLTGFGASGGQLYRVAGTTPAVKPAGAVTVTDGKALLTLPAMSVTTAVLAR